MYINIYKREIVEFVNQEGDEEQDERLTIVKSYPTNYSHDEAMDIALKLERRLNKRIKYQRSSVKFDYDYEVKAERTADGQSIWAERPCPYCNMDKFGLWHHWKNILIAHNCNGMKERRKQWPPSMMKDRKKITSIKEIPMDDIHELVVDAFIDSVKPNKEEIGTTIEIFFELISIPGVLENVLVHFEDEILNAYNKREGRDE